MAAGITGIGYNRALTGRDLDSGDLFDPAFEGHVGMFLEMRDTRAGPAVAGRPAGGCHRGRRRRTERLVQQRSGWIVRGYYGNDYLDQLGTGNLWVSMAWSGDVFGLAVDDPT